MTQKTFAERLQEGAIIRQEMASYEIGDKIKITNPISSYCNQTAEIAKKPSPQNRQRVAVQIEGTNPIMHFWHNEFRKVE